jgi:hypothetical protein
MNKHIEMTQTEIEEAGFSFFEYQHRLGVFEGL